MSIADGLPFLNRNKVKLITKFKNNEEIIDYVLDFLVAQGEPGRHYDPSYSIFSKCSYYTERHDGKQLMCAIGCLVGEKQAKDMEAKFSGMGIGAIADHEINDYVTFSSPGNFYTSLQTLHDAGFNFHKELNCWQFMADPDYVDPQEAQFTFDRILRYLSPWTTSVGITTKIDNANQRLQENARTQTVL